MSAATPAPAALIRCPRCRRQIDVTSIETSTAATCPSCSRTFEAVRFDAPIRAAAAPRMIAGSLDAAQPCAAHPRNAAVANCERCGSFICALCRIDVDDRSLCPTCFERLSTEGALESTRTTFRDYPGLAGVAATAGCVMWFLCIVLGPLAIYYAVNGLKQKKQMDERDGIAGLWAAIVVGAIQTVAGIALIGSLIVGMLR
jgi:hypothetical protein